MSWNDEVITPTSIGTVRYMFTDADGTGTGYSGSGKLQLLDADGDVLRNATFVDIVPSLTQAEKDGLVAMFERLRALAETELL